MHGVAADARSDLSHIHIHVHIHVQLDVHSRIVLDVGLSVTTHRV